MKKNRMFVCCCAVLCAVFTLEWLLPVPAAQAGSYAAAGSVVEVETEAGRMERIETDVRTSVSGQSTIITRHAEDYHSASRKTVDYESTAVVTDGQEASFSEYYTSIGYSGTYYAEGGTQRSMQAIAPRVTLSVPLTADAPNNTSSASSTASASSVVTGDPKSAWNDGEYDCTTTQVQNTGSASVRTTAFAVKDNASSASYANMQGIVSNIFGNATNGMIIPTSRVQRPTGPADAPKVPDGYDYVYIGSDQFSRYYPAFAYTEPQPGFPDETPAWSDGKGLNTYVGTSHSSFTSASRKLVIPRLYLKSGTVEEETIARWASLQQYTLSDRNGSIITAYCADQLTSTEDNFGYTMHNLSDASYYDKEDAEQIRTVVTNGYWGTESGTGSLDAFRDMMRRSGHFTQAEIDAVNEGIAMAATQHAIWFSSNRAHKTIYLNSYYTEKPGFGYPAKAAPKEAADLIYKLCFYLTDLPPTAQDVITSNTTIINEKNFLESVSVTIKDKPQGAAANLDADKTNDVYTVDLTIDLVVKPVEYNGDNLVMKMVGEDGSVIAAGRLVGSLQAGEVQVTTDENARFTFSNLQLQEGGQNIRFMLDGSQTLHNGAFLFLSQEIDGTTSQPLVSMAQGVHQVDVELDLSFELSAEDDRQCRERVWRMQATTPSNLPATGDDVPVALLCGMMLLSLTAIVVISRRRRMN